MSEIFLNKTSIKDNCSNINLSQKQIINEIKVRIDILRTMGLSDIVIKQIITDNISSANPGELLITEDFKLLLPNQNNVEIKIPTLSKAVYFFFLNHPEGVLFKQMYKHRKELLYIYMTISPLINILQMEQSIDDIINNNKNSINEKCSRIKSAFVNILPADLAQQYYITGNCGKPKRIILDRTLVINQSTVNICKN